MKPFLAQAVYTAVEGGEHDMIKEILPRFSDALGFPAVEFTYGSSGQTLLHVACQNKHVDAVRLLIEDFGASVYARDKAGKTPLHTAVAVGSPAVAEMLLSYDTKGDLVTLKDLKRQNPLDVCRKYSA